MLIAPSNTLSHTLLDKIQAIPIKHGGSINEMLINFNMLEKYY